MGDTQLQILVLLLYVFIYVRESSPVFSPPTLHYRARRGDKSLSNDKVQFLSKNGHKIAAALQLIENVASGLRRSPCQRTSLAEIERGKFEWQPSKKIGHLDKQMNNVIKTANILNHIFMKATNETEIDSLLFYSLVKNNIDSDLLATSSSIVVYTANDDLFIPYAFRGFGRTVKTQVMQPNMLDHWPGNDWFWTLATTNFSELSSRILNGATDMVITADDGVWTAPYFDCIHSTTWHVSFGAPFFGIRGNEIALKGVAAISIPVIHLDINQCGEHSKLAAFASTHRCDVESTECVPLSGMGFRRGGYRCYCQPSHYPFTIQYSLRGIDYFDGNVIEESYVNKLLGDEGKTASKYPDSFRCLPCRDGCEMCIGDEPCYVEYNLLLRSLVLCFQSFCTTLVIVLGVIVFRLRKSKVFSNAMWIMLETIIFGALLLYQTIIVRYFEPTVLTCMIEPWLRGLGFAICYGAITLKIYRILAEFQTRKAHRVCVRDKDLLKYLLGIILVVVGYLLAWTAIIVDNMREGYSVVALERTSTGLKYLMCRSLWWDYVTEISELLFLVFGVFLTYKVRNAKANYFHEKSALAWSIYIEALVSLLMYTIRHVVRTNLPPDYIYLLYFLRCQCTVTIVLALIYGPKLWYHHCPPEPIEYQPGRQLSSSGDVRDNVPEMLKLHEAITSNGDIDFSEINLSDMDPEDIRMELRRVYTQLQILRNITMRKGNPHISRRRGGRKGTHRRFSLQTFHHRHKHYHEHEHEVTEVSKTPEESTASQEGLAMAAESSSRRDEYSTPTVTFKDSSK